MCVCVLALMQTKSDFNVITCICMYVHDSLAYFLLYREPPWCAGCTICRESPCRKEMPSLLGAGMEVFQYNREYSQSWSLMWVYLYRVCFSCVFSRKTTVFCRKISEISISQQTASCLPGTPSWKVSILEHALIKLNPL